MTTRGGRRSGSRHRQRGNVAILFAIMLPVLIGFAALVLDLGHAWKVRGELQNGVDAAALAGVRDLDGTSGQLATAISSAVSWGNRNSADGSAMTLAASNVTLGNWNFNTKTFTAGTGTPYKVNAVRVTSPTMSLATWFAPVLGINSESVNATAIAVGGSPDSTCGFPIAIPACSVINDDGTLRCNSVMTFGDAQTDNTGFTVFLPSAPVSTTNVECAMSIALGACPPKGNGACSCTSSCNATQVGSVYVANGNNLSDTDVTMIQSYLALHGPFYEQVPILDSGTLTHSTCGSFQFNQSQSVTGYVELQITGATSTKDAKGKTVKTITASVNCSQTGATPPGGTGGFFGYKSTDVYLVK